MASLGLPFSCRPTVVLAGFFARRRTVIFCTSGLELGIHVPKASVDLFFLPPT